MSKAPCVRLPINNNEIFSFGKSLLTPNSLSDVVRLLVILVSQGNCFYFSSRASSMSIESNDNVMVWLFIFWAVFSHLKQFDTWKEMLVVKLQFWKLMTRLQGQAPSLIKCKHFIFSPLPNFLTEQNVFMRMKDMRDKHFSSNILFEMTILWDEQAQ